MNLRRLLLILARLLAFAAVAETVTFSIFWRSMWTPIERHYLPAYIWCSMPVITPATVEVRLIWKTARHRKPELATDDDVDDPVGGTGMALSQPARDAGWKKLMESPPQQFSAERFRPVLANLAFEGQSLGDFLLLPELSALVALCAALCTWFLVIGSFRAVIAEYAWQRRLSAWGEVTPSLIADCAVLARRVCSGLRALYRSAEQRIEAHRAARMTLNIAQPEPTVTPASFPLPLFGVYNGTGEDYLWSERDEIE
jgi:hypothetical protein